MVTSLLKVTKDDALMEGGGEVYQVVSDGNGDTVG